VTRSDNHCSVVDKGQAEVEGYFSTDFSVSELQELSMTQPLPFRDHSYDKQHLRIVTMPEIFRYFKRLGKSEIKTGLYMELKHPEFHASQVCWAGQRAPRVQP
jgi:Glycerophosphoryl diester phosphodiesterase family